MTTILFYISVVVFGVMGLAGLAGFCIQKRLEHLGYALTYGGGAVIAVAQDSWWPFPISFALVHVIQQIALFVYRRKLGESEFSENQSESGDLCPICGKRKGYPALNGRCSECDADRIRGTSPKPAAWRKFGAGLSRRLRQRFVSFVDVRSRIIALLLGSGFTFFGYQEYQLARAAAGGIEDVELARLDSGYVPQNRHLRIGRHLRGYEAMVYSARGQARNPEVKYALYPLFPADASRPEPDDIKVLVKTSQFKRVSELPATNEVSPNVEGLIVGRIEGLSFGEVGAISKRFPQIKPDELLILEEGRTPWQPSSALLYMGVGLALIGAAVAAVLMSPCVESSDSEDEKGTATGSGRTPRDPGDSHQAVEENPSAGEVVYHAVIGHHLELFAVVASGMTCIFAGVTATWTVMALWSMSPCLTVGALAIATPLNFIFYSWVRNAGPSEGMRGLDRTSWLLVAWIAYIMGAGGVIWVMMGW